MKALLITFCLLGILSLVSCKQEFEPVDYGHDACMHCRMTIIDKRFAAEILTSKGRAYKFDDMGCLLKYMSENNLQNSDSRIFIANYNNPSASFLDAYTAFYIHNEALKTPMNGNYAAFSNEKDAIIPGDNAHEALLKWGDLK